MAHLEAFVGVSVPLTAAFTDADGTPEAPETDPVYTIYNRDRKIVEQVTLTTAEHGTGTTGSFLLDYVPPKGLLRPHEEETEMYAECLATVAGSPSVGARHTIALRWSE